MLATRIALVFPSQPSGVGGGWGGGVAPPGAGPQARGVGDNA